jgi:hypothetical protein
VPHLRGPADNPGPLTHSRRSVTLSSMTRRRRTLLLGLSVLLLLAVGLAVLWSMPSEAERKAALIRVSSRLLRGSRRNFHTPAAFNKV